MYWCVYILLSLKDKKRYIASTNDINIRINDHNSGKVKSTKYRRPLVCIYKEIYTNENDARNRERFFKTHKGYNKIDKILKA